MCVLYVYVSIDTYTYTVGPVTCAILGSFCMDSLFGKIVILSICFCDGVRQFSLHGVDEQLKGGTETRREKIKYGMIHKRETGSKT